MLKFKKAGWIGCFVIGILFLTACDPGNTSTTTTQKHARVIGYDTLKMGRETFEAKCVVCHGADGRLGLAGAKVLPDTKLNLDEIKQQVMNGKKAMPSFKQVLTEDEIVAVAKYVLTLKQESK